MRRQHPRRLFPQVDQSRLLAALKPQTKQRIFLLLHLIDKRAYLLRLAADRRNLGIKPIYRRLLIPVFQPARDQREKNCAAAQANRRPLAPRIAGLCARLQIDEWRRLPFPGAIEHDECEMRDIDLERQQGLMNVLTPGYPLPDRNFIAVDAFRGCVVAINIFGLERGLFRKILRNNNVNCIDGLDRQAQLPAKDALRRQPQADIDILPLEAAGAQESVDLRPPVARGAQPFRCDRHARAAELLQRDVPLAGYDHQRRPSAAGEKFHDPLRKQVQEFSQPPFAETARKNGQPCDPQSVERKLHSNPMTLPGCRERRYPRRHPIRVARSTSSIVVSPCQVFAAPISYILIIPRARAALLT